MFIPLKIETKWTLRSLVFFELLNFCYVLITDYYVVFVAILFQNLFEIMHCNETYIGQYWPRKIVFIGKNIPIFRNTKSQKD